ncbi:hypothetical protein GCM10020220_099300 [Nonomuraea rubra]
MPREAAPHNYNQLSRAGADQRQSIDSIPKGNARRRSESGAQVPQDPDPRPLIAQ